jgi:transcriptional regulator with XRE-family HTH domain
LGVSQPAVAHWESGAHAPRFALLPRIAAILEISREEIAPKRGRKTPQLHLNVRTSQVLDFSTAPSLSYEVSRLEMSFGDQAENAQPASEDLLVSAASRQAARLR